MRLPTALFTVSLVLFALFLVLPKKVFAYTPSFQFSSFWANFFSQTLVIPTPLPVSTPLPTNNIIWPTFAPISSPALQPTPVASPTSTPKPTFTPTPKPILTPKPTSTSVATSSSTDYIMNQINNYRTSLGLSKVQTDSYTCNFAKIRAQEISQGFNHDGFNKRVSSRTLPYPSYQKVTENIAMTSDYRQVESMWQNSPGHAENMRADTPYVCVMQYGNYYAYEGWKP